MTPRRSHLRPAESLGYQVNHLARLLALALRDRIEVLGVVPGQFAQLLTLYEEDGLTQAELCERVQIEQPTMASTLGRMERDGLIERVPDPADRRRSTIRLTGHGRALEPDLVAAGLEVIAAATTGLDPGQVEAYLQATAAMIANLQATRNGTRPAARPAPAGA